MRAFLQVKQTRPIMTPKNLIQTSGYFVVCQKTCSFITLQNRLLIDENMTNKILSILDGLGIISFEYKVLINNIEELEKVLDIFFEIHRRMFHDK